MPADLAALWHAEQRSFVALAAIETVIFRRAMERSAERLPAEQLYTVDYARFCAQTVEVFRQVVEFCGLAASRRFERAVSRVTLVNRDDQWRSRLTAEQQATVLRVLERSGGVAG